MKKLIIIALLFAVSMSNAQAFKGKGDDKFSLGANLQNGGSGIQLAYDIGMAPNMSIGFAASYLIKINDQINSPQLQDHADLKIRFNANLSDVIGINKLDVYPGLNVGLRNFGGHVGVRYFFSEGFGLFSEGVFPIAKYDQTTDAKNLNNQFTFNIGAVFSLK